MDAPVLIIAPNIALILVILATYARLNRLRAREGIVVFSVSKSPERARLEETLDKRYFLLVKKPTSRGYKPLSEILRTQLRALIAALLAYNVIIIAYMVSHELP